MLICVNRRAARRHDRCPTSPHLHAGCRLCCGPSCRHRVRSCSGSGDTEELLRFFAVVIPELNPPSSEARRSFEKSAAGEPAGTDIPFRPTAIIDVGKVGRKCPPARFGPLIAYRAQIEEFSWLDVCRCQNAVSYGIAATTQIRGFAVVIQQVSMMSSSRQKRARPTMPVTSTSELRLANGIALCSTPLYRGESTLQSGCGRRCSRKKCARLLSTAGAVAGHAVYPPRFYRWSRHRFLGLSTLVRPKLTQSRVLETSECR
ncbi:hypothetical protein B0T14DRAFT_255774 [Immersiella caudata]|uniref:Uncharacterized protein n=1 Tax=Immersiella caudata TaxID=314043 RepID=A0AA39WKG9_9PEZI|nr:hypothetical protein B0T14DRAFT_255774 [Immersiella caudata]